MMYTVIDPARVFLKIINYLVSMKKYEIVGEYPKKLKVKLDHTNYCNTQNSWMLNARLMAK